MVQSRVHGPGFEVSRMQLERGTRDSVQRRAERLQITKPKDPKTLNSPSYSPFGLLNITEQARWVCVCALLSVTVQLL